MTTETKGNKNTDYSRSAVSLLNPQEVEIGLIELHVLNNEVNKIQAEMDSLIPQELWDKKSEIEKKITEVTQVIKDRINSLGSYQNIDMGWYAVKQRKVSKSYNATAFESQYPQFAPAVIIKAVDTAKLNGLIKGGLLEELTLKSAGIINETESFAYIIK